MADTANTDILDIDDSGGTDPSDDSELLQEALDFFEIDLEYIQPEYERGEEDINFSLGEQWPEQIKAARQREGRPCLTENRIDVSIIQTVNDIRQTRPSVNVTPQDDKADVETARVLKGIIRNIEQQSNANNAYDTAAENAIRGGYGWIRINTRYAAEDSFDQEAFVDMVADPFSCMLDAGSGKLDGSDATRGWVFVDMPKEVFKATWPDATEVGWDTTMSERHWMTQDTIRVAEYFYKVKEEYTLVRTAQGNMDKKDADKLGLKYDQQRQSSRDMIKWCKMTCNQVLERTEWPGKYIPLIPVYGKVVWSDGRRKSYSLTYQGRDPQMRYNFMITAETEYTALQPKSPWLAYENQLTESQYRRFAESNVKNFPILTHTLVYDKMGRPLPPPQRQQPPAGSSSLMQQAMVAADGVKATLGIFDASLGNRGNETSGKAILARQAEGDNATFHFVDNLATSIRQVGRILVDLIPKLYTGPMIARILGDDGEPDMVPLNQPVIKQGKKFLPAPAGTAPGDAYYIAPDAGKYDVSVSIGPSYASKRQEMTDNMIELFKMSPDLMRYAADIFFKNSDWDGAQELAERAKKLLPPEVQDDAPEQQALMKAQQQIQQMGVALEQMQSQLKEKQDNQAASNMLENKKIELQHQIDQGKLDLERDRLALEQIQSQVPFTPEQFQGIIAQITETDAKVHDVGQALHILMGSLEQETQGMPPEQAAIATPTDNMVT